jgi:hypothetical protein
MDDASFLILLILSNSEILFDWLVGCSLRFCSLIWWGKRWQIDYLIMMGAVFGTEFQNLQNFRIGTWGF